MGMDVGVDDNDAKYPTMLFLDPPIEVVVLDVWLDPRGT